MEVLIVLALLMAGFGIGLPAYNGIAVHKEEERFFELLRNDIYFAQSTAYHSEHPVTVFFRPDIGRYDVGENLFKPLLYRKIPKSVTLRPESNLKEISYWKNGAVFASGTIRFSTSTGEKTIVVHLGKGRVVFSE